MCRTSSIRYMIPNKWCSVNKRMKRIRHFIKKITQKGTKRKNEENVNLIYK